MPDLKTSKICDPLYAYIYLDQGERALIDHSVFQRLRAIQQLGFSDRAFPSGTGNRFSHSLGVCHLAGLAFDSVFNKNKSLPVSESKKRIFRKTVKLAGLLHDIGHGPLSHSSEALMPPLKELDLKGLLNSDFKRSARHEDYSVKFIMEKEGLHEVIKKSGVEPSAVAQLLHREFFGAKDFFVEGGLDFLPLLRQIISSDFDVDRMDYLQRDSLYCGVKYGLIDFSWLISHFDCHVEKGKVFLAIGREALYTLESFILGRQHMRLIVYFHHKSVSYNQILKEYARSSHWKLPSNIQDYVLWTDSRLFEKIKSDDNIWAQRINNQSVYLRLYETLFFESSEKIRQNEAMESLKKMLEKEGLDFIETHSAKDTIKPSKTSLKKYSIYLKNRVLNQTGELYQDSAFLPLPDRKMRRLYVQPEHFSKAKSLLSSLEV